LQIQQVPRMVSGTHRRIIARTCVPWRSRALSVVVAVAVAGSAASVGRATVTPTDALAILMRPARVYYRPDVHAAVPHQLVSSTRPYTHTRTVLPVLAQKRA